jgi:hypothetical protein
MAVGPNRSGPQRYAHIIFLKKLLNYNKSSIKVKKEKLRNVGSIITTQS